jgi:predicted O-methyltransferase YrrM
MIDARAIDHYGRTWYDAYDSYEPDSGRYDAEGRLRFTYAMEYLDSWLSRHRARTVVQIGAGTGKFSLYFARKYPEHAFIATDLNPTAVRFMSEKVSAAGLGNLAVSALDITRAAPSFAQLGTVDFIFGHAVFLFVSPSELDHFIRVKRSLLPDALLAISENVVVRRVLGPSQALPLKVMNRLLPTKEKLGAVRWEVGSEANLPNNRGTGTTAIWSHNWQAIERVVPCEKLFHRVEHYSTPERILAHPEDGKMVHTLCHSVLLK